RAAKPPWPSPSSTSTEDPSGLGQKSCNKFRGMLGEPPPHPLIGPRPLKRVGVEPVVLRGGNQHMLDQFLSLSPRAPFQVAMPKRSHQQFRLVQPRSVGRRQAGSPPTPAPQEILHRVASRVAGVPVLDQEHPLQAPMPAAEGFQFL